MKKFILTITIFIFSVSILNAQTLTTAKNEDEAKKAAGQGITFKIPDGVMPMEWKKQGFKGVLMLAQKDPSGIFIVYPNEKETIEELTIRVKKNIVPMFMHDDKNVDKFQWKVSDLLKHEGDKVAKYHLYEGDKNSVQILIYEKEWNGLNLIYGYFAMKNKDAKEKDIKKIWANENGEGIKVFDKFWKTLPK